MKKITLLASLGLCLVVSSYSHATVITYGGVTAGDGSGLTSAFMDPLDALSINAGANGYFIETFDTRTQMYGYGSGSTSFNENPASGCALNSTAAGIVATGSFGIGLGSVSGRATPATDSTCFGYTPSLAGNNGNGSVNINYSPFLTTIGSGLKINYLGFYWGSADIYNTLSFYSGNTLLSTLTGSQLLNANGGTTGNQLAPGSNVYVNIGFTDSEAFDRLVLTSTSRAFEVDNIVIGTKNVPEPASLGLLALGLLGMRIYRKQ